MTGQSSLQVYQDPWLRLEVGKRNLASQAKVTLSKLIGVTGQSRVTGRLCDSDDLRGLGGLTVEPLPLCLHFLI